VIEVKKTIAIIVVAIFVFAIASVSFATGEKAEMAKPAENTSADVPKATRGSRGSRRVEGVDMCCV